MSSEAAENSRNIAPCLSRLENSQHLLIHASYQRSASRLSLPAVQVRLIAAWMASLAPNGFGVKTHHQAAPLLRLVHLIDLIDTPT